MARATQEPAPDFSGLIDRHQTEILRYLARLAGDTSVAEDLFQETFLRAFRHLHRLPPDANRRAWLYRIATNLFLNHRRAERRRPEVDLGEHHPSRSPSPSDAFEFGSLVSALRDAIARLPPKQRAAFVQRRLQGLSYAEVGDVLDCTESAARASVYQAARRLRRELAAPGVPSIQAERKNR